MESISKKIRLYRSFGTLKYQDMESNSQEWATDEGINNCLIEVFKNEAHIIHPNLSSILSPVDTENILGVLNYIETLQKIIIQDGGELRKPVIAIWHSTETQSFVGAHWQTLVILPKYYITFDQRPLENPNELIFFKDPYYEGKSIPKAFKNLLNNRISFNNILGEDQQNEEVKMGGIMPNAEFYDTKYINVKQQKDESSCGWWAVYNAIMFVMTGSDDFIRQFSSIAEDLSNPLRYIFESFKLRLNPKSETVQKEMNKKDQNPMNQEFQNFSDTLNFELYSVLSGINNTETAIKFQINSKKDLLYCASPDSFKVLVTSDIHVDKTLFIKEIIDSGSSNNILITRPRRWGKTLNLDMLKSFFEIDIDEKRKLRIRKNK
jgi:Predicted AAA-ATPase